MKRKVNNAKKQYKNRILEALNAVFSLTNDKEMTDGFAKYKKNTLFTATGLALLKKGYVVNNGSKTKPAYTWEGPANPESLLNEIYETLSERFKYRTKAALMPIAIEERAPKISVVSLLNYTDQELWNELKSRQYSIQNNHLCKLQVLE